MTLDKIIFGHVTIAMLIVFFLSILFVFLYSEYKYRNAQDIGYKVSRYLKFSWLNLLFYICGGLLLLIPIDELGELLVSVLHGFFPSYNFNSISHGVFSAIAGATGAPLIAWGLEKFRKWRNKTDQNIVHVHGVNCKH